MDRTFDGKLNDLKKLVLAMGGHVESAIDYATRGLTQKKAQLLKDVHSIEQKINQEHLAVDNACFQFLAKQGPVAKDLRFVFSLIKLNSDLERMGDQAVNISHSAKDYLAQPETAKIPKEIQEMSSLVQKMVKESLDSFVREDVDLAKKILVLDDEVDQRKDLVFEKLTEEMRLDTKIIEAAMDLILIARNLERLGDHATNIAEEVIFLSTGKDVRHGGNKG